MPSSFSWLDYSEHERRQMLDVVRLFGEQTTRDELGLGGVRDAFADSLFPGTSTLQTRARYFLLVPWMYGRLEDKEVGSRDVASKARKHETDQINRLADEDWGVIGKRARENVLRLPSSVYWQGLGVWGIRTFAGSQDEYHRSLDRFYLRRQGRHVSRRGFEGESATDGEPCNWHSGLPPAPHGAEADSFVLSRIEAEFLRERVLANRPRSLLAFVLRERIAVDAEIPFVWYMSTPLPDHLREMVDHGHNFSEVLLGAQLLYNLMLAELCHRQDWMDTYHDRLGEWWQMITARRSVFERWDRRRFWSVVLTANPRVSSGARHFINDWIEVVLSAGNVEHIVDGRSPRQLIDARERHLKRGLSRLHNQRARERWPGASGAGQMDLRWPAARRILRDILAGLEEQTDA